MPLKRQVWQARNNATAKALSPSIQRAEQEELLHHLAHKSDAQQLSPTTIQQLQRTIGNQATTQLVTQKSPSPTVQRNPVKLRLMEYMFNKSHGQQINDLAEHLYDAITALEVGAWKLAHEILYNREMAGGFGHRINLHFKAINPTGKTQQQIDEEVNLAIGKGMYIKGQLNLPDVGVFSNLNDVRSPENDPHLAKMILPVALEEWIHMFQHLIQGVLSAGTEQFMQSPQVIQNQQLPVAAGRWNMNEVDIYAIYKDLGWDDVLEAFKARYPERIKYEEFTEALRRGNFSRRGRRA